MVSDEPHIEARVRRAIIFSAYQKKYCAFFKAVGFFSSQKPIYFMYATRARGNSKNILAEYYFLSSGNFCIVR